MKQALIVVGIIVVLGVGWYLASPLFINEEVDEAFPLSTITEEERKEMEDAMKEVGMELPSLKELQGMTQEELDALEKEMVEKSADMPDKVMNEESVEENESSGPIALLTGMFRDADSIHKGEGEATVYDLGSEGRIVRFENFNVTNGPDLRVLLATHPDPQGRSDVDQGYIELGKLKGNIGNQNYTIPSDINLDEYNSIVIYCKPFHVVFSVAPLQ